MEKLVRSGRILSDTVGPWIFPHDLLNLVDIVFKPGEDRMMSQDFELYVENPFLALRGRDEYGG
jgi:hypothetical protein